MDATLEPWQIVITIRLQNAVRYLRLLELDEQRARIYSAIYRCEDVKEWARNHARNQIELINQSATEHHPRHTVVRSVAVTWCDELKELGLCGAVSAVGGIRTEAEDKVEDKVKVKVEAEGGDDGRESTTASRDDSASPLARDRETRDHAAAGATRLPL